MNANVKLPLLGHTTNAVAESGVELIDGLFFSIQFLGDLKLRIVLIANMIVLSMDSFRQ